jgi:hypothetical protein
MALPSSVVEALLLGGGLLRLVSAATRRWFGCRRFVVAFGLVLRIVLGRHLSPGEHEIGVAGNREAEHGLLGALLAGHEERDQAVVGLLFAGRFVAVAGLGEGLLEAALDGLVAGRVVAVAAPNEGFHLAQPKPPSLATVAS